MNGMLVLLKRVLPQLATLLAVVLLIAQVFPGFFDIQISNDRFFGSPVDIVKRGAPVALLAIGMTLVIATKGIDLSVGAVMAICGAVASRSIDADLGLTMAIVLALSAGLVCGLWNGLLVAVLNIQPIVATLILMVAGRGIAQLITEGTILTFSHEGMNALGIGAVLLVPTPIWIWMGMGLLVAVMVRRTALGMLIESVGINLRASTLSGLDTRTLIMTVYMVSGVCAAMAGIIVTADIKGADANNAGLWLELDAILAVVIGGNSLLGWRFSLLASLLGAMIIQSINTGILLSAIVLIILVMQSPRLRGMQGRKGIAGNSTGQVS